MRKLIYLTTLLLISIKASAQTDDGRLITIPVIFHVIYVDTIPDNGISETVRKSKYGNSTTKLPREKILAELKELDNDFQNLNTGLNDVVNEYKPVIGNPRIHFKLKEIIYLKVEPKEIHKCTNTSKFRELSPPQNPENTLNVYVSKLRVKCGGSEGITSVPIESIDIENDGVNLNYSWVGLNYHLLSHEVGHWLGLWHVDDMQQVSVSNITDIPVQTDLTDIECVECSREKVVVVKTYRQKFTKPNNNNFMDYSGCRSMFSIQQSRYMRNIIIKLRSAIYNNSIKM